MLNNILSSIAHKNIIFIKKNLTLFTHIPVPYVCFPVSDWKVKHVVIQVFPLPKNRQKHKKLKTKIYSLARNLLVILLQKTHFRYLFQIQVYGKEGFLVKM